MMGTSATLVSFHQVDELETPAVIVAGFMSHLSALFQLHYTVYPYCYSSMCMPHSLNLVDNG